MSSSGKGDIGLEIIHNGKQVVYARWVHFFKWCLEKDLSETNMRSANVQATLLLEIDDMVEIGKYYNSAMAETKNYFEGRMVL